ncbi:MAG: CHASE2 domain-containing protein [Synergistaceae bacterium]|jgi:HD-GYP domain-containing protein (c-di-GMP phosphodiesterase class II)/CHASE2 domain-containing sensor protein|nr:CHASE2 domain-containing protein [Synergistaceae bacterium]
MSEDREHGFFSRNLFRVDLDNLSWGRIVWTMTAAVLGVWLSWASPEITESCDRRIYDRLLRHDQFEFDRPMIRIVANSSSVQGENADLSWPRSLHARLLKHLKGARAVVLDIPFENPSSPEEDNALIQAVREHGHVIGRARLLITSTGIATVTPFPALREAFRKTGIDNQAEDPDGVYRKGVWGAEDSMRLRFVPSLALTLAEELDSSITPLMRVERLRINLPWKTLPLERTPDGLFLFQINHPRNTIPTYDYEDVLNERIPDSTFLNALVIVSFKENQRRVAGRTAYTDMTKNGSILPVGGTAALSKGEYILHTAASLMTSFVMQRISPVVHILMTFLLVGASTLLGFVHFKKSLIFLVLFFLSWPGAAIALFLQLHLWFPLTAPFLASVVGYIGSQVAISWRLDREWNVRALSIRPLLELAQESQADFGEDVTFDDYLRSMWKEIEEKTGIELKSTRVSEHFSLIQNYLQRASRTSQKGQEFQIIHNASDTPPRHRMLLPLPLWKDPGKPDESPSREYVILGWDGRVPAETLSSLAVLVLFAAVHFHGAEESRRRKNMLIKTIEAIMVAVEAKDATTSEHSRRVAAISKKLAQWMKLSPQEVDDIYFSAVIHDIGKLGISDKILNKPGALDPQELAVMRRHPLIGESIMRPVELPDHVMSGILQHHERHDGKGYPYGIRGDQITMAGRIIKVADVFDALVNRRQYKEPWTEEKVRNLLLELRGTEFDPQIVDIFIRNLYQTRNNPMFYYGIQL